MTKHKTDGKIKMNIKKTMSNIQEFLNIKCPHKSAENKDCNFCPDCGKKVTAKWTSIKCNQCGQIRAAKKNAVNSIIPEKNFCGNCGSESRSYRYYYDYNIPDKLKEISVKSIVEFEENPFLASEFSTQILVENPFECKKNFRNGNVIKVSAKKKFKETGF